MKTDLAAEMTAFLMSHRALCRKIMTSAGISVLAVSLAAYAAADNGKAPLVNASPSVTAVEGGEVSDISRNQSLFQTDPRTDALVRTAQEAARKTATIDPKLAAALDPRNREIDELNARVESLQNELKRAREAMGVRPDSAANIPAVPSSVVTDGVPEYGKQKGRQQAGTENGTITVKPGVNQIVTIAVGQTNRIITPFAHPQVSSAAISGGENGEAFVKDNVVYISTARTTPFSVFITDKGNEDLAISLTLLPRKIPSREVRLTLSGTESQMVYGTEEAETWEKSQPYVTGIKRALREIAMQNVPSGYQLSSIPAGYKLPKCSAEGFAVDFSKGQLMAGSRLHYVVGKITNVSAHTLEFRESTCGDYDIAAVAVWPYNMLEPGKSSEIYVVRHAPGRSVNLQKRASVLDR